METSNNIFDATSNFGEGLGQLEFTSVEGNAFSPVGATDFACSYAKPSLVFPCDQGITAESSGAGDNGQSCSKQGLNPLLAVDDRVQKQSQELDAMQVIAGIQKEMNKKAI